MCGHFQDRIKEVYLVFPFCCVCNITPVSDFSTPHVTLWFQIVLCVGFSNRGHWCYWSYSHLPSTELNARNKEDWHWYSPPLLPLPPRQWHCNQACLYLCLSVRMLMFLPVIDSGNILYMHANHLLDSVCHTVLRFVLEASFSHIIAVCMRKLVYLPYTIREGNIGTFFL